MPIKIRFLVQFLFCHILWLILNLHFSVDTRGGIGLPREIEGIGIVLPEDHGIVKGELCFSIFSSVV